MDVNDVLAARERLKGVSLETPLMWHPHLSDQFQAEVFLKREDLQPIRSYKLRGAYNKMASLSAKERENGVVCASAGNHAQGVAFTCKKLQVKGHIFMPVTTPAQKLNQVKMFGKEWVEIVLCGDTFDDANEKALAYSQEHGKTFVHPFDDEAVIAGQATVAVEMLEQMEEKPDVVIVPCGGGGLLAGVSFWVKTYSPQTEVIAVEPSGAASLTYALQHQKNLPLPQVDKFVDGASVKKIGDLNFEIVRNRVDDVLTVPEGQVCSTILKLYNEDAIVVEPAGALSISVLQNLKEKIKGKKVVCVVSGSNNDITRTEEIKERSLLHEGLKHYFIVRFPQRAGALKEFVSQVLGPTDDITYFEYSKRNNREKGPAVVGLELKWKDDFQPLVYRLERSGFGYEYLNNKPDLMQTLL